MLNNLIFLQLKGKRTRFVVEKSIVWFEASSKVMVQQNWWVLAKYWLQKSLSESTLYVKCLNSDILFVSLYMDDLLVTRRNIVFVEEFKQDMIKVFEMTDCREIAFFSQNGS